MTNTPPPRPPRSTCGPPPRNATTGDNPLSPLRHPDILLKNVALSAYINPLAVYAIPLRHPPSRIIVPRVAHHPTRHPTFHPDETPRHCGVACPGIVAEPHTGCSTPALSPLAAHIVYTPPAHAKEGRRSDPLHSSRRRLWHRQDDGAIDAANASHMLTSVRTAAPANPGTPRHARIRPAPPADAWPESSWV